MRRVVITGYGIVSPIGNNKDEIVQSFINKKSGVIAMPHWEEIQGLKSRVAGKVQKVNKKVLDRKSRRSMGDVALYSTLCTKEAIEDAKLPGEILTSGKCGVASASTIGSPQAYQDFFYEIFRTNGIDAITSMSFSNK